MPTTRLGDIVKRALGDAGAGAADAAVSEIDLYRLAIENARDLISVLDADGRYLYVSPSVSKLLGYGQEELLGTSALELVHPDDVDRAARTLARSVEAGSAEATSIRLRTKEGQWRIVEGVATAVPGDSGPSQLIVAAARDVTERHAAEEAAQRSSRQLEVILRSVADAITVQDRDGNLVFANDAAARTLGYGTVEELLATTSEARLQPFELLDADGRPLPLSELPGRIALERGEEVERLVRYRVRATGDEQWSVVRASAVGSDLVITTFHDITDRVRAQRRLQFLAEASALLGASLDWEATLSAIARLTIPTLADWVIVDVLDADAETIRQVAVAAADPHKEEVLREMRARYQPTLDSPQPAARALREGEAILFPDFTPESLRGTTRDDEHFRLIQELDPVAAVAVPLVARDQTLGAITLAWSESGRGYDESDVALAGEVARRAALAVDNARLYEQAQQAARQNEFLAEATTILASSLDYQTTLARVAELAVPRLADWCTIDMAGPSGELERLAVAHTDPEKVRWADELQERFPPDPDAPYGVPNVIRTGESELFTDIPEELLVEATKGQEELLEILRELGLKSSMCVPLVARGRVLGAITFVSEREGRRLTEADLAVAEDLARRAAIAVDNARLYYEAERRGDAARVLEHIADGVFMLDRGGVVRLWNRAAERVTGLAAADVVGHRVEEVVPGWSAIAERVPMAASPGSGGARAETLPLELPGRELWLSLTGVEFAEGIVYAFRDLTEERALEELRSEFVSTVSHELRTPLAAVYGAALTLRRDDLTLEDDQRENLLAVVADEADRLARTVNDILWASRLDSGTLHVEIESCDAAQLARSVVAAAEAHVPAAIRLRLDLQPELPLVAGDPDKVRQVLANLVDNAVKYSPDGGPVEISIAPRDGKVRFSVRDHGLGIPVREQRRIFEKFYRLDPNMTRGVGGTGLGLYICSELVRRMDGRIWVDSREGAGSVFSFELPTASPR